MSAVRQAQAKKWPSPQALCKILISSEKYLRQKRNSKLLLQILWLFKPVLVCITWCFIKLFYRTNNGNEAIFNTSINLHVPVWFCSVASLFLCSWSWAVWMLTVLYFRLRLNCSVKLRHFTKQKTVPLIYLKLASYGISC